MKNLLFPPTVSFWEIREYLTDIDLLVVGSGIVGLTTAIFYRQQFPERRILVVERGMLPSGASTKNAGFACFGSASEVLSDLQNASEEEVYALIEQRLTGLRALRNLIGDGSLAYRPCGGYEIFRNEDGELFEQCLAFIPRANRELKQRLGLEETYRVVNHGINDFGFEGVGNLILNRHEGALDTGKMMNCLLRMASDLGIMTLNGMELIEFTDTGSGVEVRFGNDLTVKAAHLHMATNGFARKLLPELDVRPARAQVLVTSPIEDLKVRGTFHMNEGFYYFRNVGDRILFGGGRQLDMEGETDTRILTTELIQRELDGLLRTVILPNTEFEVEHRWAGIMGVGQTKKTIVKRISDHVSCAVRLGGMGVAIGTSIGRRSAELIGGS